MLFTSIGFLVSSFINKQNIKPIFLNNKPDIPSTEGISEPAALDMLQQMQYVDVLCPTYISDSPVPTNVVIRSPPNPVEKSPIVLIHGFDSSCAFSNPNFYN